MKRRTTNLSNKDYAAFRRRVWRFYRENGRHFAWRTTRNPYEIAVSELMLQQTQTSRVAVFYPRFLAEFPSLEALANAPLGAVLRAWQGLGYNRRAKFLWLFAQSVLARHGGCIPDSTEELRALPGIGHYTAAAIRAFAFERPAVLVETNTRAAVLHHFFPGQKDITDKEISKILERCVSRRKPREWYYALMDYGSYVKKIDRDITRRSAAFRAQPPFRGSRRELRGLILRELSRRRYGTEKEFTAASRRSPKDVENAVRELLAEGLLKKSTGNRLTLAD